MGKACSGHSREASGYIVVVTALLLVALLGGVALVADFGMLYSSRTGLQSIADSAALAGASTFVIQPLALQPATAEAAALGVAVTQSALGRGVTSGQVNVQVDLPNRFVEVQINRNDSVFFARALGFNQVAQGVSAFAEASLRSTGANCVKPIFLPSSVVADATACAGLTGKDYQDCLQGLARAQCGLDPTDASSSGMQLLLHDTGNGIYAPTAYGTTQLGNTYNIRPTSPKTALAPSNFYSIRFNGNSGAKDFKDALAGCTDNATVYCETCVSLEPGNMNGPTNDGVTRFTDLDGDGSPDHQIFPPSVTGDALGRYCFGPTLATCVFNDSHQLGVVPVWDVCAVSTGGCPAEAFCPSAKYSGANVTLRIAGWATVFIHGMFGGDVRATLLNLTGCEGSGAGTVPGLFGTPLQLVGTRPPS